MSDFNAAQVLAEAYTLYKKHHDGLGLDFKIAIAQVRKEAEQRGAIKALREAASERNMHHLSDELSDDALEEAVRIINWIQDRAYLLEGDDE